MFKQILRWSSTRLSQQTPRRQLRSALPAVEALEERYAPALSIVTPIALPNATVGVSYPLALAANGGMAPYTWSVSPVMPAPGLSLNTSSGMISGTPTAGGQFSFTVTTTDSSMQANTFSQPYLLTVNAPTISITPTTLPNAGVGVSYSETLSATGGTTPYTWTVATGSTLPSWLSLDKSSGKLTGTPATTDTGSTFTITATDNSTGTGPYSASQTYTLTVGLGITSTPATLPSGTVGVPYGGKKMPVTFNANGSTMLPYTWSVSSGSLPPGLQLSSTAGTITGTPTGAGSFTVIIQASDSSSTPITGMQQYSVTIKAPTTITVSPTSLPTAHLASRYSQKFSASGGTAPFKYKITSGSLPKGLSLSPTGVLSGTPQVQGSFPLTVQATDSSTGTGAPFSGTVSLTLMVGPALPSLVSFSLVLPNITSGGVLPKFQVLVEDALGNPLKGVKVTLQLRTLAALVPGSFGPKSVLTATTGSDGKATFSKVIVDGRGVFEIEAIAIETGVGTATGFSNAFQVSLTGRHFPPA
jgi:hypothetical protein